MMIPTIIKICGEEYGAIQISHRQVFKYTSKDTKYTLYDLYVCRKWLVPDKAVENLEWNGFTALIEVDGEMVEVYRGSTHWLIEKEGKTHAEFERHKRRMF